MQSEYMLLSCLVRGRYLKATLLSSRHRKRKLQDRHLQGQRKRCGTLLAWAALHRGTGGPSLSGHYRFSSCLQVCWGTSHSAAAGADCVSVRVSCSCVGLRMCAFPRLQAVPRTAVPLESTGRGTRGL